MRLILEIKYIVFPFNMLYPLLAANHNAGILPRNRNYTPVNLRQQRGKYNRRSRETHNRHISPNGNATMAAIRPSLVYFLLNWWWPGRHGNEPVTDRGESVKGGFSRPLESDSRIRMGEPWPFVVLSVVNWRCGAGRWSPLDLATENSSCEDFRAVIIWDPEFTVCPDCFLMLVAAEGEDIWFCRISGDVEVNFFLCMTCGPKYCFEWMRYWWVCW